MKPLSQRFPQKRAFITGAGSGLGRTLSLKLAQQGWTLGIADINLSAIEETRTQVLERGGQATCYKLDVADAVQFEDVARAFISQGKGVDLVVNNAGVGVAGLVESVPLDDWKWIVGINLWGPIFGCRLFLPQLKTQGSGLILNIASMAGLITVPTMAPYHVTKFGLVALSETLRVELVGSGVEVAVVCPSFFKTNIVNATRAYGEGVRERGAKLMAQSKMSVDQVADAILVGLDRGNFYIIPQPQARMLWWVKRLAPNLFSRLVITGFRKSI